MRDEAALTIERPAMDVANFYELKRKLGRDPTFEEFACYGHIDPPHMTELRLIMWDTFQAFILPEFARLVQRYSGELTIEKIYTDLLELGKNIAKKLHRVTPDLKQEDIEEEVWKDPNMDIFSHHLNGPWVHRLYTELRSFIKSMFSETKQSSLE